jgi:hypothetical protein
MLKARRASGIAHAKFVAVAEVRSPGLVVMLFQEAAGPGWLLTALNFGRQLIREAVVLPPPVGRTAQLIFNTSGGDTETIRISDEGSLDLSMEPIEGAVFRIA